MSKQQHPGLYAAAKANGILYITAYQRMRNGWSFERATTEQPRPRASALTLEQREAIRRERWEQKRAHKARPRVRKYTSVRVINDSAPPHIRTIRAALCDEFLATGQINGDLFTQLKGYANEVRAATNHPAGVPAEPQAQDHRGWERLAGDNGRGGPDQIDGGAAALIYDYLRTG